MRLPALLCAALAAALIAAGCGGGGGTPQNEAIAKITPPDAAFYVSGSTHPQGDQKANLDQFLSAVLDTEDPGQKISDLIDQQLSDSATQQGQPPADFDQDIKPWLGDTVGSFVMGTGNNAPSIGIAETTNADAALSFLQSRVTGLQPREYKGATYQVDSKGEAVGKIGDFVARGDEPAFKAAIDASQGESLADSSRFKDASDGVPNDSLGEGYFNLDSLLAAAAQGATSGQSALPPAVVDNLLSRLNLGGKGLIVSADATPDSVGLDFHGIGALGGVPPALLAGLPEDSTFAFGLSDIGGKLKSLLTTVEDAGIPGLSKANIELALSTQGIDLEGQVLPWMGDAALFIRGSDPANLDGALVIDSKDDAAAAQTMDKLGQLLKSSGQGSPKPLTLGGGANGFSIDDPSFSQPLDFVQQSGRFVIGVGDAATQAALNSDPAHTLAQSPSFSAASTALGGDASLYASVAGLLPLITTNIATDPQLQQLEPYLKRLAFLTAGSGDSGLRVALGANK